MSDGAVVKDTAETPSRAVIDQAAKWLVLAEERPLSAKEETQLAAWRVQSRQHEQAWQAAMQLKGLMGRMPASLGKRVLGRERMDRRALVKGLAGLAVLAPAAKLTWDALPALTADYRTATGEQRSLRLPDGSELQLNTATAVNVQYTASERLITLLGGELWISTAADPTAQSRPFVVDTAAGRVRALGTRFGVRATGEGTARVQVYRHAVAVTPALAKNLTRFEAGQTAVFDRQRAEFAGALERSNPAWTRGQIISDNQRLEAFIKELARYRPGVLRCDPAVADLRISGVFQLHDTDQALAVIAKTLPVRISRVTDYWVTVTGRAGSYR